MWQQRRPGGGLPSMGRPVKYWRGILSWLALMAAAAPALGVPPPLSLAGDLSADGREAAEARIPVVLFFSRARCGWCEKARVEHVNAMAAQSGGTAVFRQIDVDRDTPLVDFSGRRTTHRAFAAAHKVKLTPTLLFFSGDGTPLADPIRGYYQPEFYGTIIEEAIEESRNRLGGRQP